MAKIKIRQFEDRGDCYALPLSQGRSVLIDKSDLSIVSGRNWFALEARNTHYAVCNIITPKGRRLLRMHRLILSAQADEIVDHVSGDGLDCRRNNLRIATHAQNMQNQRVPSNNSSGFKGVFFCRTKQRFVARISANGKVHHIGQFATAQEAAQAYSVKARLLHGDFARCA